MNPFLDYTKNKIVYPATYFVLDALGYARIPGLYNEYQVDGWKRVTSAVHEAGGKIFAQLMHTGRVSHPDNMDSGTRVVAPSAITLSVISFTTA